MAFILINDVYAVVGQTILISGDMPIVLAKVVFYLNDPQPSVTVADV